MLQGEVLQTSRLGKDLTDEVTFECLSNRERGDSYSYGERLFWPSKGSVTTICLPEKGNKQRRKQMTQY